MKVLLISPKEGIVGGIAIWTKNILIGLKEKENVNVVLNDFSRKVSGQMILNPIKKILYAFKDYLRLTYLAIDDIKKFDGSKVHICSSASYLLIKDLILIKAARCKKLQSIVHFHFGRIPDLQKANNWEWQLIKKVCRQANKVIVMDKKSYNILLQENFNNVYLLPNPISNEAKRIIDKNDVQKVENTLLFAGHCIPTKGIFELIGACKKVKNIHLTMIGAISSEVMQLLISGAGPDYSQWLDIKGQVSYEDTIKYMKRSSIFVLPSYTEGFPNVILESMACGCCVIASAVGAIPEMLEEENLQKYGLLITPKRTDILQNTIENAIRNPDLIIQCGNNAKQRVFDRYSIEKISQQLVEIWEN